jgi:hypothetical protein
MTRALILENGLKSDVPEELIKHIERSGLEWNVFDMSERFWPECALTSGQAFKI